VGGRSHLVAGPSHHAGTACVTWAEIVNFRCFSVMAGGTGCLALEGARGTPPVRLSGALCSSSCIDCGGSGAPIPPSPPLRRGGQPGAASPSLV
jgi:hypothetical protein